LRKQFQKSDKENFENSITMNAKKKIDSPVTLFAAIEASQHEALRAIAFEQRRSLADVVREAIDAFLASRGQTRTGQGTHVGRTQVA